jgi:hypothetical protein
VDGLLQLGGQGRPHDVLGAAAIQVEVEFPGRVPEVPVAGAVNQPVGSFAERFQRLRLEDVAGDELKMSVEVLQELRVALVTHQTTHLVAALGEKLRDVPTDESRSTGQTDLLC